MEASVWQGQPEMGLHPPYTSAAQENIMEMGIHPARWWGSRWGSLLGSPWPWRR